MKGPGMRLDLDVRRVWQCPACGREVRSSGQVVGRVCSCTKEGTAMRLVELTRPLPPVRLPQTASETDGMELADFPTDIPIHPPQKRPPRTPDSEDEDWLRPPVSDTRRDDGGDGQATV